MQATDGCCMMAVRYLPSGMAMHGGEARLGGELLAVMWHTGTSIALDRDPSLRYFNFDEYAEFVIMCRYARGLRQTFSLTIAAPRRSPTPTRIRCSSRTVNNGVCDTTWAFSTS